MPTASVLYLVINLPHAEERRHSILAQGEKLGLDIRVVPAIYGKDLDLQADSCGYDRQTRLRLFTHDMLPNEVACALSHRKAIKTFLDSDASYAVVLEDDAVFDPNFNEGIRELTEHLQGWEAAKLFTDDGKLYPICPPFEGAVVQPCFPKKLPWVAVGYLYSRKAAQELYDGFRSFWLAADAHIGRILLERRIPTIGVCPGLIHSGDPNNEASTLDAEGVRSSAVRRPRTLRQYIAYRLSVIRTALGKRAMRKLMSKRISRR